MTHFIEHIIEPNVLLLTWQTPHEHDHHRYVVAELHRFDNNANLKYLTETDDFRAAQNLGFEFYPAFRDIDKIHENVLDAFMRRVPPRNRSDFEHYLKNFRIKPDAKFSNFALLGYSGAKLPTDGFSIIHPFTNVTSAFEALVEIAGFRFNNIEIDIGAPVSLNYIENHHITQKPAIGIMMQEHSRMQVLTGLIVQQDRVVTCIAG